jgi:hypothetical protein
MFGLSQVDDRVNLLRESLGIPFLSKVARYHFDLPVKAGARSSQGQEQLPSFPEERDHLPADQS